jgi:uncharacterized protein (DUF2147 family)
MSEPSDIGDQFDRDYSDLDVPGLDSGETESTDPPQQLDHSDEAEAAEAAVGDEAEAAGEDEAKAAAATAAKPAAAAIAAKKIGFKAGDQSVELQEDAVTDWKVDGKPVKVPLKELLQNYSGKVAWEKRFQEVSDTRKTLAEQAMQFEAQKSRHSQLISDMHTAAREGRTFDAISSMIQMTGVKIDAREYVKNLREALIQQASQLASMTPEQRAVHEQKEELEYLKSQGTRLTQQREQEQAQTAFQSRVANAMKGVNSTVEEYVSTRDWLLQNGPNLLGNKWDPKQVTPEFVANQIRDVRDYRTAKEALESVDPKLAQSETIWKQAVDIMRQNPDWTVEDLKDVYRESTKQVRSQKISNKVAKSPTATTATASTARPKRASREDYSSFDEADLHW